MVKFTYSTEAKWSIMTTFFHDTGVYNPVPSPKSWLIRFYTKPQQMEKKLQAKNGSSSKS